MGETENKRKMPIFYIGIFILLILWGVFCGLIWWKKNLQTAVIVFLIGIFIVIFIAIAVFVFFWLFKKHRVDMIHVAKQRITASAELHKMPYKQEFRSRGSIKDNISWSPIGVIKGICLMKTKEKYKMVEEIDPLTEYKIKKKEKIEDSQDLMIIAFNKGMPFPLSIFDETQLFFGYPEDVSNPSGIVVYANGILAPQVFGIFFLSKHFEKTYMIDESMKELIYRYVLQDNLSEIKNIVDDAIAISPEHQKHIERSNLETFQPNQSSDKK